MPVLNLNFYVNNETTTTHAAKLLADFLSKSDALVDKVPFIDILKSLHEAGAAQIDLDKLNRIEGILNNPELLQGHDLLASLKQPLLDSINEAKQ